MGWSDTVAWTAHCFSATRCPVGLSTRAAALDHLYGWFDSTSHFYGSTDSPIYWWCTLCYSCGSCVSATHSNVWLLHIGYSVGSTEMDVIYSTVAESEKNEAYSLVCQNVPRLLYFHACEPSRVPFVPAQIHATLCQLSCSQSTKIFVYISINVRDTSLAPCFWANFLWVHHVGMCLNCWHYSTYIREHSVTVSTSLKSTGSVIVVLGLPWRCSDTVLLHFRSSPSWLLMFWIILMWFCAANIFQTVLKTHLRSIG